VTRPSEKRLVLGPAECPAPPGEGGLDPVSAGLLRKVGPASSSAQPDRSVTSRGLDVAGTRQVEKVVVDRVIGNTARGELAEASDIAVPAGLKSNDMEQTFCASSRHPQPDTSPGRSRGPLDLPGP
jgi:hypothetical protein